MLIIRWIEEIIYIDKIGLGNFLLEIENVCNYVDHIFNKSWKDVELSIFLLTILHLMNYTNKFLFIFIPNRKWFQVSTALLIEIFSSIIPLIYLNGIMQSLLKKNYRKLYASIRKLYYFFYQLYLVISCNFYCRILLT